ncbi:MAG: HypC/HybG/HupF family hydrogenase formation chaperone [Elusimicrobiota bacterium]|jgi:hydrogenase expression/formation protein HypC
MCLAVPGKVLSIGVPDGGGLTRGRVDFGGTVKDVCLAYTPEAKVGDYVIVHVGFALNVIDEDEALKTLSLLSEMDAMVAAEERPA